MIGRRHVLAAGAASIIIGRVQPARAFDRRSLREAEPGDIIELPAETVSGEIKLKATGTPENPVIIRSAEPFATHFLGPVDLKARHVRLEGIRFSNTLRIIGDGNTLADTMHSDGQGHAVDVKRGEGNRVEHILIERWNGAGIALRGASRRTTVIGCLLRDAIGHQMNGKEALRVGIGREDDRAVLRAKIERCRIARWDLDDEVISVKSTGNLLRQITVEQCRGRVQNRYGMKTRYEGLWLRDTHGLRIQDSGNKVLGCRVEQSRRDGLYIGTGNVEPGTISRKEKAGHPYAVDTLVSGCTSDRTIIGEGYDDHRFPALRTVVRAHDGPIRLGHEQDSLIEPDAASDEEYAKAVFLTDDDVGPRI